MEAALKSAGVDFDLSVSKRPNHLVELAADSVERGFSTIVIAGGDGSIGQAVNGIARHWNGRDNFPATIGIIPLGTANDFVFGLGLPLDLNEAVRAIANGKTKSVDLCKCNESFFINNSGICLEPYVSTRHERIRRIKGAARYLVAAIWAIMDKPEWQCELKWDDGEYNGPISLGSIGNGRRTGGFFMTSPCRSIRRKIDVGFRLSRNSSSECSWHCRALIEGKGNYVELAGMHEIHCTRLHVHLDKPSPAHVDGELFDEWLTDFDYQIFPAWFQC